MKFEYMTLVFPYHVADIASGFPDVQTQLNRLGSDGWQLKQMILPSSYKGTTDNMVAILERTTG